MSVFKNQETYWENLFDEEDGLSAFPYFKAADKASLARTQLPGKMHLPFLISGSISKNHDNGESFRYGGLSDFIGGY
ncbi:hypothetical protein ACSE3M_21670 [Bacillus velezensis]